jgi:hypothetical protein
MRSIVMGSPPSGGTTSIAPANSLGSFRSHRSAMSRKISGGVFKTARFYRSPERSVP